MASRRGTGLSGRRRILRRAFKVDGTIECEIDSLSPPQAQAEATAGAAEPEMKEKMAAVVVLCHGQWSSKYDPLLMALSEGILRDERALDDGHGVEVVRFTFGTRFTEPFSGYDKEKVELLRVIGHLERVMGKTVRCVLGHSKAATVVCLALGELSVGGERIGAACISGRFDMSRGVERSVGRGIVQAVMAGDPQLVTVSKTTQPFWLTRERLEERAAIDMGRAIATMSQNVSGNGLKACFLVAHGESDERIPVSDSLAYARAFRERGDEAEVHLIPGADHCFTTPGHRDQLVGRVVAFVHGTVLR